MLILACLVVLFIGEHFYVIDQLLNSQLCNYLAFEKKSLV
jgi:hypothetical protein